MDPLAAAAARPWELRGPAGEGPPAAEPGPSGAGLPELHEPALVGVPAAPLSRVASFLRRWDFRPLTAPAVAESAKSTGPSASASRSLTANPRSVAEPSSSGPERLTRRCDVNAATARRRQGIRGGGGTGGGPVAGGDAGAGGATVAAAGARDAGEAAGRAGGVLPAGGGHPRRRRQRPTPRHRRRVVALQARRPGAGPAGDRRGGVGAGVRGDAGGAPPAAGRLQDGPGDPRPDRPVARRGQGGAGPHRVRAEARHARGPRRRPRARDQPGPAPPLRPARGEGAAPDHAEPAVGHDLRARRGRGAGEGGAAGGGAKGGGATAGRGAAGGRRRRAGLGAGAAPRARPRPREARGPRAHGAGAHGAGQGHPRRLLRPPGRRRAAPQPGRPDLPPGSRRGA